MKALYRKYRPKNLGEVVGQKQITETLSSSLTQNKISHAYLFTGPRGTGKTSVARIFAHEVNGFSYQLEETPVDIVEIDGASNRGIDNIRELREKAMIAPTSGKYKVYIIDEVHMLTKEAFNALLKTLEEPPEHVIFIMATTDAHKVPITITSRAQTYSFKLADPRTMFDLLRNVADKEEIKIDDDALNIVVRRGGGSFRDSLSLLDQISTLSGDTITGEKVEAAMGLPEDRIVGELLLWYSQGDFAKITASLRELFNSGIKPEVLVEEIITRIIDNPQIEFLPLAEKLSEVRAPFIEAKLLVALCPPNPTINKAPSHIPVAAKPTKEAPIKKTEVKEPADEKSSAAAPKDFNWDVFLEQVKSANDAVYLQLLKTKHKINDGALEIFPEKRIVKTILSRANNKQLLAKLANGLKIEIRDAEDNLATNDATIAKISDIMGGEVKNDGGENPFG